MGTSAFQAPLDTKIPVLNRTEIQPNKT